jgi:hypothetical protein
VLLLINVLTRTVIGGSTSAKHSHSNSASAPYLAPHPVRSNYRKVHVIIIHWEVDRMDHLVGLQVRKVQCLS